MICPMTQEDCPTDKCSQKWLGDVPVYDCQISAKPGTGGARKSKSALDHSKYIEDLIADWQDQEIEDVWDHVELLTEAEEELRRLRKALAVLAAR